MEKIYPYISLFISSLAALLPIFFLVALGLFAFIRTNTSYSLLDRFWLLVAGSRETGDKKISKFSSDIYEIERFQFVFGIKAKNPPQILKLINFSKRFDIEIKSIKLAQNWFDINNLTIRNVKHIHFFAPVLLSIFSIIFLSVGQVSIFSSLSLLEIKKTNTLFLTDGKIARIVNFRNFLEGKYTIINKDYCQHSPRAEAGISIEEANLFCSSLGTPELQKIVDSGRTEQQILGLLFIMIFLYFSWQTMSSIKSIAAAKAIYKKLPNSYKEVHDSCRFH